MREFTREEALEYMKTGRCPFSKEIDCPEDLMVDDMDLDQICTECITRRFP